MDSMITIYFMFRGSKMAAWAGSADILRASSVKTAIKNTGIKCVNNPYSAFLTDKTVPLNASTSLTVPVYVTVTLSPSFTLESPSGF